jgi:DNA-binding XRE family transcriptional regulator
MGNPVERIKRHPLHLEEQDLRKKEILDQIHAGTISMGQAIKGLRITTGKTQTEYAKNVGVFPRVLINIENEVGNPTIKTLNKIVEPFGLKVGFVENGHQ